MGSHLKNEVARQVVKTLTIIFNNPVYTHTKNVIIYICHKKRGHLPFTDHKKEYISAKKDIEKGIYEPGLYIFPMAGNYLQLFVVWIFDKPKTLHTRYTGCSHSVRNFTVHARLCTFVLAILLYFTPLFNLSACSPINDTAKTILTTSTTIFCSYYFIQYLVSIIHLIISSIRSINICPHHF